jgi:hypothetical protein
VGHRSGFRSPNAKAIHRGSYTSVRQLNAKIRAYKSRLERPLPPLRLTKTADQRLKMVNRKNNEYSPVISAVASASVTRLHMSYIRLPWSTVSSAQRWWLSAAREKLTPVRQAGQLSAAVDSARRRRHINCAARL